MVDAGVWTISIPAAIVLRYDFDLSQLDGRAAGGVGLLGAVVFGTGAAGLGLYRRRWGYGSFDELAALAAAAVLTGLTLFTLNVIATPHPVPRSSTISGTFLATVGMFGTRFLARQLLEQLSRPGDAATPVLVYGAGHAGTRLVRNLRCDPASRYRPVALLDDDRHKANLTIAGIRVAGGRAAMAATAERTGAEMVVLAMPSAPGETVRELVAAAEAVGLGVKTVPTLAELADSRTDTPLDAEGIRPLTEIDLLGRGQVETDLLAAAAYVTGRRVLVTGAGGSIGSELCRQLHALGPGRLVMVDRDESGLHAVELSICGRALLEDRNLVVADIRDTARLDEIFAEHQPHVVFHAAALKHLPLLQLHPDEAVKTNVLGTANVLAAAAAHGVERFVNVSTDKAANPTSVLGYSKRIAERLTADTAAATDAPYVSVRFGNVIGSRGSVVPTFRAMIDAGGPLTVTHPEVTRFFMTIPEAAELVIQAGAIGSPGEVLILDMGEPVRIAELARRLIAASGRDIAIEYTGLRPGEKLHEDLLDGDELDIRPIHPLITHTAIAPLPHDTLTAFRFGGVLPPTSALRTLALGDDVAVSL